MDYRTNWSVWNNTHRVFLTQRRVCGGKGKDKNDDVSFDLWVYAKISTSETERNKNVLKFHNTEISFQT